MRIISGKAKGTRLKTADSNQARPTKDVVKEAVFNMIQNFPENSRCLDLYAGSGNLGLEAASRGAEQVTFVEIERPNCEIIKKNIEILGFDNISEVFCQKASAFLNSTGQKYDLVFIDPPYDSDEYDKSLQKLINQDCLINPAIIIVEFYQREKPEMDLDDFLILREKEYGNTGIYLLEYQG
ncbi:16S rRNA (guanine(966)-N(2))-methyltransferase RsmD [Halarsenatibacter silvermanii]|uniref:16S rRNA (Guanine(966)-N(2))-methyltransferase RsmD n=1 Tax=Halarsenatibacter silvermanii TaxID=321763 RepID=A0A1G9NSE4_9FIRM|nr:16S rRNA (guanine(966)-N(2))-methyltransferase RsmD [Halarsenatibacter silvermanii]SDL89261.1 16S rRNA (guanine(966)-N(2))-methyltransferase RsmD [Halarsenatibacter silvermanii]